jgi:hypothetical protein
MCVKWVKPREHKHHLSCARPAARSFLSRPHLSGYDRIVTFPIRSTSLGVVLPVLFCLASFTRVSAGELKRYDSKYYTIYTDLDPDAAREAVLRMTRMADEYHARTAGFAGEITAKFPFYLYTSAEDYYAAGGLSGTAGVFIPDPTGGRLMAVAGRHPTAVTWHNVQHEGFHQFAHAVIGGRLPAWLDEGLAEYFGESIFTGDGFVTGIVPPWRLARLKREISGKSLKPVDGIMALSPEQWRDDLTIANYDQAWSMVYFLVHGEHGRYEDALSKCIRDSAAGRPFAKAWAEHVGTDAGFEQRWSDYWTSQPASPTSVLYDQAACAGLTSFLARATAQRQTFTDFAAFRSAAESGELKTAENDWLPPSLLCDMLRLAGDSAQWTLTPGGLGKPPQLIMVRSDGVRLTGSYTLSNLKVAAVTVDVDDLAKVLKDARAAAEAGNRTEARDQVSAALREHPHSPAASEAQKFLQALRAN